MAKPHGRHEGRRGTLGGSVEHDDREVVFEEINTALGSDIAIECGAVESRPQRVWVR